ncbi:MAG: MmcB family DNA repair protein [Pseudomonadota bacterium]
MTETAERAPLIRRGVARHLMQRGEAVLAEVTLATGRRADLVALDPKGRLTIVEIKSGLADLAADRKWREYLAFADRFCFAVDADFPLERLPDDVGILVADRYDAALVREPAVVPLAPARRKAMQLRFARLAAARLQAQLDPEFQVPWSQLSTK